MSSVLVTGGAGFVGYHFSKKLLDNNFSVIIVDNLEDFYDINYKLQRLALIGIDSEKIPYGNECVSGTYPNAKFIRGDICDRDLLNKIFLENRIEYVVHLAARSGARGSFSNPHEYVKDNIDGTTNLLDVSSKNHVRHFVFTSSSSVYGNLVSEDDKIELKPVSFYGATKLAAEIILESYSRCMGLPVTIGRLFSVYGPLGRPDGFIYKCVQSLKNDITIELFNKGNMWRDFIYIDDAVEILFRMMLSKPANNFGIYDVGTGVVIKITDVVETLERILGRKAKIKTVGNDSSEAISVKAHKQLIFGNVDIQALDNLEANLRKFVSI